MREIERLRLLLLNTKSNTPIYAPTPAAYIYLSHPLINLFLAAKLQIVVTIVYLIATLLFCTEFCAVIFHHQKVLVAIATM